MQSESIRVLIRSALLATGLFVAGQTNASASSTTWSVANNGVDSPTCGTPTDPCRSISQAILNASAGDVILVGPGQYGDLNFNGVLGEPGEEQAAAPDCFCAVGVSKSLKIVSTKGAAATFIDIGDNNAPAIVRITASHVQFGQKYGGFTLKGPALAGGIVVEADEDVAITGNIATPGNGSNGIALNSGTNHRVIGNLSSGNGNGFLVASSHTLLRENIASANLGDGFQVFGSDNEFIRNYAQGNRQAGFTFNAGNQLLRGNSILANRYYGVYVSSDLTGLVLEKNNLFGNGVDGPNFNCALVAGLNTSISATNNFWGAASGPGADPADEACAPLGTTTTHPFATQEFDTPDPTTHTW